MRQLAPQCVSQAAAARLLLVVRLHLLLVVRFVVAVALALTLEVAVAVALTEHGASVCVCVCVCAAEVFVFALRGGSSKKRELNIVVRIKDAINIGAAAASSSKVVLRRVFLRVHVSKLSLLQCTSFRACVLPRAPLSLSKGQG